MTLSINSGFAPKPTILIVDDMPENLTILGELLLIAGWFRVPHCRQRRTDKRRCGLNDVAGRKISEIIHGYCRDNPEALEVFGRVAQTGEAARWEHYLAALGMWFSFSIYRPAQGEFIVVIDNITERKRAEDALRESEARFRQLFDLAPLPLALVSKDGFLLDLNARFIKLFGYTRDDVPTLEDWWPRAYPDPDYRGRVIATWECAMQRAIAENIDIVPNEYRVTCKSGEVNGRNLRLLQSGKTPRETFDRLWYDIVQGRPWKGEFCNKRKDGSEYIDFAIITPISQPDGRITHYVAVQEDITHKTFIAEELKEHRHHLETGDIKVNDLAFEGAETLRVGLGETGEKLLLLIRNFEYDEEPTHLRQIKNQ